LRRHEGELAAANARLLFVGTGTPAMAADFAATHAGPHPVFSDVQRRSFQAAGLRRSIWSLLHPRMLWNLWRALRGGFRQGKVLGDAWQQGGVLVFAPDARMRHVEVDGVGGDQIDVAGVLAAVR
jgi:hypothetical protein